MWNQLSAFIDHGNNTLPFTVRPPPQGYVQTDAVIYTIGGVVGEIVTYDIYTGYLDKPKTHPRMTVLFVACLASIDDSIIITFVEDTFILNISNLSWTLNPTPSMSKRRTSHSCMIEPDEGFLYVIGGHEEDAVPLNSIEKLYVKDISNINQ